jgi:hypothetical protein
MAVPLSAAHNYTNSSLATNFLLAVPRFAKRAGAFAIHYIPDHFDSILAKLLTAGTVIADPTLSGTTNISSKTPSSTSSSAALFAFNAPSTTRSAATAAVTGSHPASSSIFSLSNLRTLTSFGSYIISKWALTTFIVAVALNRTQVYASARVALRLNVFMRAALYCVPIAVLFFQSQTVIRALRCQSSPDWSIMRYQNASMHYTLDHAGDGGLLYEMSRSVLFWETDEESCRAIGMAALPDGQKYSGSLSLLWPLFLSFCASSFVETLVSALQNRQPITENSLFEQSLAFAEAEALVVRPFEIAIIAGKADPDAGLPLKTHHVKRVMNVTQEVLLISLISALSNLSSNILAVFGKRKKWRLVNTAVWGFAYMGAFIWGIYKVITEEDYEAWNFRFPTVFVIGFIPHLLIITGMIGCAAIYAFALLLMMVSPPPGQSPTTIKERFQMAYENLQANVYLATGENIRFSWEDDFYSSLLKAGFTILSCASEAVYLNESTNVRVGRLTWLEQNRIDELTKRRGLLFQKAQRSIPNEIKRRAIAGYATTDETDQRLAGGNSGYAVERKPRSRDRNADPLLFNTSNGNIGIVERHGRLSLAFRFISGLFWLSLAMTLHSFFTLCRLVGITYRPAWVRRLVGPRPHEKPRNENSSHNNTLEFWVLNEDGISRPATDPNIDVEAEMRRQQLLNGQQYQMAHPEDDMDEKLYDWWKQGGWWGEADSSGTYTPVMGTQDDDTTSVISSTATDDFPDYYSHEWITESDSEDGQRTPTRQNPFPFLSTQNTDDLLDPSLLANLLDPQSIEHQHEARMLARRLRTPGTLTRAAYARRAARDRAAVLTSSRAFNPDRRVLDAVDEERRLEAFILEQRVRHGSNATAVPIASPSRADTATTTATDDRPSSSASEDWATGAPGMGSAGPLCVVCQDAPRTVLLWPCGCLALCDECRVIMATRNFTNCVCCRTATEAFSRLYVP